MPRPHRLAALAASILTMLTLTLVPPTMPAGARMPRAGGTTFALADAAYLCDAAGNCIYADPSGHPRNSAGFVTDGTPQADDGHCVGQADDVMRCVVARRPGCRHYGRAMDRHLAWACWAAPVNAYDWPHDPMMNTLFCESKGDENAQNPSGSSGLLQSTDGRQLAGDAPADFTDAYWNKWRTQGASAWAATWGRECAA